MRHGTKLSEPRHVRLYHWMLETEAYRSLDVYARLALVEIKRRYTGSNNGDIPCSGTEIEIALGCSNKPADRAIAQLIDRGFIKVARKGSFDWKSRAKGATRATTWILTEYAIDYPVRSAMPATKEFMRWRKTAEKTSTNKPQKKTRGDESTAKAGPNPRADTVKRCEEHPNEVTRAPEKQCQDDTDAVTRAPSYSVPDGGADQSPINQDEQASSSVPIPDDFYPVAFDDDDAHETVSRIFAERGLPMNDQLAAIMCSQMVNGCLSRPGVDAILRTLETQFREVFAAVHDDRVDPHCIDPPEDTLFAD